MTDQERQIFDVLQGKGIDIQATWQATWGATWTFAWISAEVSFFAIRS